MCGKMNDKKDAVIDETIRVHLRMSNERETPQFRGDSHHGDGGPADVPVNPPFKDILAGGLHFRSTFMIYSLFPYG